MQINQNYNIPNYQSNTTFKSMKKSHFHNIDYSVVERFKAPIEKFNTDNDYKQWIQKLIYKLMSQNLEGRKTKTNIQRQAIISTWLQNISTLSEALKLIILSSIMKNLDNNNDNLPPLFDKKTFEKTITELQKNIENSQKYLFNFEKIYSQNLKQTYLPLTNKTSHSGWIVIPSLEHDPDNFENNVKKLQALSHDMWCTTGYSAETHLSNGDFHIYLDNDIPRIGIRFDYDYISEIQGIENNSIIPAEYIDIVTKHIKDKNLKIDEIVKLEIKSSRKVKAEKLSMNPTPEILQDIEDKNYYQLLTRLGFDIQKDENNLLIIQEYHQFYSSLFERLGIDENDLFKHITEIQSHADFSESEINNLGNLKKIGGYANFNNSKVTDLGNLKEIGGNAYFSNSSITNLKHLKYIGGDTYFQDSQIRSLGELETINGYVLWGNAQIEDYGELENIRGNIL